MNFVIFVFKYLILFGFILFFGRAFLIMFFTKFKSKDIDLIKIQGINIYLFYPILGLFALGNLLVIFNFFLPLKSNFVYIIFLFPFINIFKKINFNSFITFIKFSSISIILLISSYNINFHYDAGLYHLNNQLWLRESNIVLGFSNIYGALGVSSIYEYISALFWIDHSYILLHFVNLIFISTFYSFLLYAWFKSGKIILKSSAFFLLVFSLLDNFGKSGGRNGFISIQGVGKQDLPIAVLFLLSSLLIISAIINKESNKQDFIIFSSLSLFLFQLKVSAVTIGLIYIIYLFYYMKKNSAKTLYPFIFLFLTWTLKSILQTGCIIFPFTASCINNLSWVNKDFIKIVEDVSVGYSYSYSFNYSFLNWLDEYYSIGINSTILTNYIVSVLILYVIKKILFEPNDVVNKNYIVMIFIFFNIIFYLRFGPDSRYLMGLQLLLVSLFGLYSKLKKPINNNIFIILIIFSVLFLPRIDSYKSFKFFEQPKVYLPTTEMSFLNNRLIPLNGDQCWVNLDCSASKSNYKIEKGKYFRKVILIDS